MEIELTTPSLTFEFGGQGGSGQSYTAGSGIYITDSNQINAVVDNETITINEDNQLQANFKQHDYLSLERLNEYLFKVTFDEIPEYIPTNEINTGACTSFVKDGKLYRNFDWNYDERATFIVRTKDFEGIAYIDGLNGNDKLNLSLVEQLPYHLTDGCNNYGIRVAEHVLFNDFGFEGSGDNPIQLIPYKILTECNGPIKNYLEGTEFTNYLSNLYIPAQLSEAEYLLHFIVTDGTDTYYVGPSEDGYEVIDITDNPKLTNFKWVNKVTVNRTDSDLQDRPTGIERWNQINFNLNVNWSMLNFTRCYIVPNRLSEFIGINGTTKDSTDEELEAIYDTAHQAYLERTRNGYTWQTVHSVVYDENGIRLLYTQEDYSKPKYSTEPERYVKNVIVTDTEAVFFDQDDNFIDFRPKVAYYVNYNDPDYSSAYNAFVFDNLLVYTFDGTRYYQAQSVENGKIRFISTEIPTGELNSYSVYIHEKVLNRNDDWDFGQPKVVPYAPLDWPDRTAVLVLTWHNGQFEWVTKDSL